MTAGCWSSAYADRFVHRNLIGRVESSTVACSPQAHETFGRGNVGLCRPFRRCRGPNQYYQSVMMSGEQPSSNSNSIPSLVEQAERCRRLSRATYDRTTAEILNKMAENFERKVEVAPGHGLE